MGYPTPTPRPHPPKKGVHMLATRYISYVCCMYYFCYKYRDKVLYMVFLRKINPIYTFFFGVEKLFFDYLIFFFFVQLCNLGF